MNLNDYLKAEDPEGLLWRENWTVFSMEIDTVDKSLEDVYMELHIEVKEKFVVFEASRAPMINCENAFLS
jgi:hypothetical protein